MELTLTKWSPLVVIVLATVLKGLININNILLTDRYSNGFLPLLWQFFLIPNRT
jgi:hypothetical protein